MVRIKAKTMAVTSYAPKNGYRPAQLDQSGNPYGSYFPPSTYQQPCPTHMPAQQLYDFTNEMWASAATGYQECAEVSPFMLKLCDMKLCQGQSKKSLSFSQIR